VRWPWPHRVPSPSEDARAAVEQMGRALRDTDRLSEHVTEVSERALEVARRADEVRARNHVAEAVTQAIMRRARLP
jgi:hypothetical protein